MGPYVHVLHMNLDVVGEGLGHEWETVLEPGKEPVQ